MLKAKRITLFFKILPFGAITNYQQLGLWQLVDHCSKCMQQHRMILYRMKPSNNTSHEIICRNTKLLSIARRVLKFLKIYAIYDSMNLGFGNLYFLNEEIAGLLVHTCDCIAESRYSVQP
ncbi:hypothetical protein JCM31598_27970 [Desulfonatronum parangueonense]